MSHNDSYEDYVNDGAKHNEEEYGSYEEYTASFVSGNNDENAMDKNDNKAGNTSGELSSDETADISTDVVSDGKNTSADAGSISMLSGDSTSGSGHNTPTSVAETSSSGGLLGTIKGAASNFMGGIKSGIKNAFGGLKGKMASVSDRTGLPIPAVATAFSLITGVSVMSVFTMFGSDDVNSHRVSDDIDDCVLVAYKWKDNKKYKQPTNSDGRARTIYSFLSADDYKFTDETISGMLSNGLAESYLMPSCFEFDFMAGSDPDTSDMVLSRSHHRNWDEYTERIFELYASRGLPIDENGYKYEEELTGREHYYPGIGIWQWTGKRAYGLQEFSDTQENPRDNNLDGHNDGMYSMNHQLAYLIKENWNVRGMPLTEWAIDNHDESAYVTYHPDFDGRFDYEVKFYVSDPGKPEYPPENTAKNYPDSLPSPITGNVPGYVANANKDRTNSSEPRWQLTDPNLPDIDENKHWMFPYAEIVSKDLRTGDYTGVVSNEKFRWDDIDSRYHTKYCYHWIRKKNDEDAAYKIWQDAITKYSEKIPEYWNGETVEVENADGTTTSTWVATTMKQWCVDRLAQLEGIYIFYKTIREIYQEQVNRIVTFYAMVDNGGWNSAVVNAKEFYDDWLSGPNDADTIRKHLEHSYDYYTQIKEACKPPEPIDGQDITGIVYNHPAEFKPDLKSDTESTWQNNERYAASLLVIMDMEDTNYRLYNMRMDMSRLSCTNGNFDNSSIAAAAVSWAWPQNHPEYCDIDDHSTMDAGGDCWLQKECTSLYVATKNIVSPLDTTYYSSCDRNAATAILASGSDDDFPMGGCAIQIDYLRHHPEKWQHVTTITSDSDLDMLEPGDIILTAHHTIVFVGGELAAEKWPDLYSEDECKYGIVSASRSAVLEESRGPRFDKDCHWILSDSRGPYEAYRCTNESRDASPIKQEVDGMLSVLETFHDGSEPASHVNTSAQIDIP